LGIPQLSYKFQKTHLAGGLQSKSAYERHHLTGQASEAELRSAAWRDKPHADC